MAKASHKSAPIKVAAPQSTFLKPQGLCQIVLFQKNPFVGRQLFLWPNPVLKQNFLNQPRFAVCF